MGKRNLTHPITSYDVVSSEFEISDKEQEKIASLLRLDLNDGRLDSRIFEELEQICKEFIQECEVELQAMPLKKLSEYLDEKSKAVEQFFRFTEEGFPSDDIGIYLESSLELHLRRRVVEIPYGSLLKYETREIGDGSDAEWSDMDRYLEKFPEEASDHDSNDLRKGLDLPSKVGLRLSPSIVSEMMRAYLEAMADVYGDTEEMEKQSEHTHGPVRGAALTDFILKLRTWAKGHGISTWPYINVENTPSSFSVLAYYLCQIVPEPWRTPSPSTEKAMASKIKRVYTENKSRLDP